MIIPLEFGQEKEDSEKVKGLIWLIPHGLEFKSLEESKRGNREISLPRRGESPRPPDFDRLTDLYLTVELNSCVLIGRNVFFVGCRSACGHGRSTC